MNGFQELANAIIEQAAKDYRAAQRIQRRHPDNYSAHKTVLEVEQFFRSDWFAVLSDIDGEVLLRMLKEEFGV